MLPAQTRRLRPESLRRTNPYAENAKPMNQTLQLICATAPSELRKDAAAMLAARLAAWPALAGRVLLRLDPAPRSAEPRHRLAGRLVTVTLHFPAAESQAATAVVEALHAGMGTLPALLGAHWTLVDAPRWVKCLPPSAPVWRAGCDLRLSFRTPMTWDPHHSAGLGPDLLRDLLARVVGMTQQAAVRDLVEPGLRVLTHFGQLAAGQFRGHLFLRGVSPSLLQALGVALALHLVEPRLLKSVEWRGRFEVAWLKAPWLDAAATKVRPLARLAAAAMAQDDTPPLLDAAGGHADPLAWARQMIATVRGQAGWQPRPTAAFVLHQPGRNPRTLEQLDTADLLLQQHLLQTLQPALDRCLAPFAFGYRPGLGREAALERLRGVLRDGYTHVLRTDIAQCFASIPHEGMMRRLDEVLPATDVVLRRLLRACMAQSYTLDGRLHARTCGLAQGAPLSPLLMNLYLGRLDEAVDQPRWRPVRFADDMVVCTRTRAEAREVLVRIEAALAELGLQVSAHKTAVMSFQQGFHFLGEHITPRTLEPVAAAVAAQRKPLLITEPYLQLGVNGAALEARRNGRLAGIWPLRRLSGLIVMARCNLSSTLLERCSSHDIPLAVSLRSGKQIAVLVPNQRRTHEAQHRHACWHDTLTHDARLALAGALIQAKLANTLRLVQQRQPDDPLVPRLQRAAREAERCTTVAALRGHEGAAARLVFAWLQQQVLPAARPAFTARRRARGTPDRLNSALNFCYYLLFTRINAMLRLRGLNPYLGWLHDSDDDYETLVYDLMEPFRVFVDRLLLRQINRQALQARDFESDSGEHRLSRPAARALAEAFEHMLGEKVGPQRLRDLLWTQVRAVDEFIQGSGPLWIFRWALRPETHAAAEAQSALLTMQDDAWAELDGQSDPAGDTPAGVAVGWPAADAGAGIDSVAANDQGTVTE